jgi:hypothetical protein
MRGFEGFDGYCIDTAQLVLQLDTLIQWLLFFASHYLGIV